MLDTGIAEKPVHAATLLKEGAQHYVKSEMQSAVRLFRLATEIEPDNARAHLHLAYALLAVGNFCEGWREHRWAQTGHVSALRKNMTAPEWAGERLAGGTILLFQDAGHGDTIMFSRFIAKVKERVPCVVLGITPELISLFHQSKIADTCVTNFGKLPRPDFYATLMTLPEILGAELEAIRCEVPYLHADPARIARWKQRLSHLRRPRIGLAWRANPLSANGPVRSMKLAGLTPILRTPGVDFISLQVPFLDEDRAFAAGFGNFHQFTAKLLHFGETAALMKNLDLVITVDTSVAHLAGAIGAPAFVLLPMPADWRWFLNRSDSPWYPTLRLFRSRKVGDWSGVVAEAAAALRDHKQVFS